MLIHVTSPVQAFGRKIGLEDTSKEYFQRMGGMLASAPELFANKRDWLTIYQPPEGINLIVAVSFGLFVPSRILRGAKYGGLNVHPSLLPEYVP